MLETTGMDGLLSSHYVKISVFLATCAPLPLGISSPSRGPQSTHTAPTARGGPRGLKGVRSQEDLFSHHMLWHQTCVIIRYSHPLCHTSQGQLNAPQNASHTAVRLQARVVSPFYRQRN